MVVLKTARELSVMQEACRIAAMALQLAGEAVEPGVSTLELDTLAEKFIRSKGARPNFKGLYGFPATACISINNEVIHGIPSKTRKICAGDIVSVDLGAKFQGYHGDNAATFACGDVSAEAKRLISVTKDALYEGIKAARKAKADIIVLCSSDDEYATLAPQAWKKLQNAKETFIVAGAPACMADLQALGIQNFINVRSNVLETLKSLNQQLLKK